MVDDGLEFIISEHSDQAKKLNRKTLFVGNGTQITNLPVTTEGQLAFCIVSSGSFLINRLYSRLAGNASWSSTLTESAEQSISSGTDNVNQTNLAGLRFQTYMTFPTTEKFYVITGIEWKNGTTLGSTVTCGVSLIDADPPVNTHTPILAFGALVTQTGTNAIQRNSNITSMAIRGGTLVSVWTEPQTDADFRAIPDGASQNHRQDAIGSAPTAASNNAWTASTVRLYHKLYFRGYI